MRRVILGMSLAALLGGIIAFGQEGLERPTRALHPPIPGAAPKKDERLALLTPVNTSTLYERIDLQSLKTDQRAAMEKLRLETDRKIAKLLAAEEGDIGKLLDESQRKAAGNPDSLSEMGEMTSMRLQSMMDRRSKMFETLSNLMKKMGDTSAAIVQNMK